MTDASNLEPGTRVMVDVGVGSRGRLPTRAFALERAIKRMPSARDLRVEARKHRFIGVYCDARPPAPREFVQQGSTGHGVRREVTAVDLDAAGIALVRGRCNCSDDERRARLHLQLFPKNTLSGAAEEDLGGVVRRAVHLTVQVGARFESGGGNMERLAQHKSDCLRSPLPGTGADGRTAPETLAGVFAHAAAGDLLAAEVIDTYASKVALALAAFISVTDPEVGVLGGGLGNNALLVERVSMHLAAIGRPLPLAGDLGETSSAQGAAVLALDIVRRSLGVST